MDRLIIILLLLIFILIIRIRSKDNQQIINNTPFQIKESSIKDAGRGLFATKDYKEGDIIELCPAITVDNNMDGNNLISHYLFSSHGEDKTLVAFGYCSLISHSEEKRNCSWEISGDDKVVKMFAIKDIKAGEEFFSHYGDEYWKTITLS